MRNLVFPSLSKGGSFFALFFAVLVTKVSLYLYEALPSIAEICLRNISFKQT